MIKKVFKIIGLSFASLIGLIIIFCIGVIANGSCIDSYVNNKDLKNWMNNINDNTLVNEIVMPGSHDGCSYDMLWLGETQQFNIEQQLEMGVRYFDIRVNKTSDNEFIIYHDIINGVKFLPILDSIKTFIMNNPSETLLLDFQHFKGNSQNDVLYFINEYLLNNNLLVVNDTTLSDLEFISSLTLKDSRGKCIIFWGDRSNDPTNYTFLRNNDNCSHSNMSLNSYYESDFHKNNYEYLVDNGYPVYFDNIKDKINNEFKGIFVLQAQLTDGNLIFGPYSKEKVDSKNISNYILSFIDKEELKYLNVIMRDFLNEEKCEEIISLNMYKHTI